MEVDVGRAIAAEVLLAATEDVAVVIRRITAYRDRFTFFVVVRLRTRDGDAMDARVRLELPDGRVLGLQLGGSRIDGPRALPLGGGSTDEHYSGEYAVDEIPPPAVTFVCDWPQRAIVDARASVRLDGR